MGDSFLVNYRDYLLGTFPYFESGSLKSSLDQSLVKLKNVFEQKRLDIAASCTGTSTEVCWIASYLAPWNRMFFPIRIQLVATTPIRLTLCSLPGRYTEPFDETVLLEACILVHWLLKWHHCIHKVHLNSYYYKTSQLVCLFHDALLQSKGVRQLLVSCVSDRHFGGDILAAALGCMDMLSELELREVSLDGKALNDIGHKLGATNTLTKFTFFGNAERPQSSSALLEGVKLCTNLKAIKICVMYIGSDSAQSLETLLKQNKDLEKVAFWNVSFTCKAFSVIATSLGTFKQLKRFEFVSCVLQQAGIPLLAEAIKLQREIRSLRVDACKIGDSNAENTAILAPLIEAVMNSNLQELNFSNIPINDVEAQTLAKHLSLNHNLHRLFLKDNALTAHGATELLKGISLNRSEAMYQLGHVATDDAEAEVICRLMQKMGISDRVQITYGDTSYFHLSCAIRTNFCKIMKLLLEDNLYLTAKHLEELFSAISHNVHITQLVVKSGQFNLGAADALGSALTVNRALKSLELDIEVHPLCQIILFKSLTKNASLTELSIKHCRFDEASLEVFVDMLKKNKT